MGVGVVEMVRDKALWHALQVRCGSGGGVGVRVGVVGRGGEGEG